MNPASLMQAIDGKKTYVMFVIGGVAIFLNHLGWWPNNIIPLHMDPSNWVNDEYTLIIGATFRSAFAKNGAAAIEAQPGAKQ